MNTGFGVIIYLSLEKLVTIGRSDSPSSQQSAYPQALERHFDIQFWKLGSVFGILVPYT